MTAEPSDPQPDLAALDRRLRVVEHRQEHELTQDIAATGEAVRLLHDGLREVDRSVTRVGQRLDQVAASQQDTARALVEQTAVLATIAGRVYDQERVLTGHSAALDGLTGTVDGLTGKVDGLTGKVDAQAGTLESHGGTMASHGEMLASHGEMLASHGEMLAEILRRLPAGPGE